MAQELVYIPLPKPYDKPMIYYPLAGILAGIGEILIITRQQNNERFMRLFRDGSDWEINLSYTVQPNPDGLAKAIIIGKKFWVR